MANVFQDPTKTAPRSDPQIVRVKFEKMDLMNSTMPPPRTAPDLGIQHVPNAGTNK